MWSEEAAGTWERCGTGNHESSRVEGGFVDLCRHAGWFSQTAARWWCCSGSIPVGPEVGPDKAWHCPPLPCPPPPREFGAGWGTKARYYTTLISMKSKSTGWGWVGKREERRLMSCQTQGSRQTQKRRLLLFALGCLRFVPTLIFRAQHHHPHPNHSFTNPRKVPCGERLSFALPRGMVTLRISPWCRWKTPAL